MYPYLLCDVAVEQVWNCDITYIRLRSGFVYPVAILGLVQPLPPVLGVVGHPGWSVLPGRARLATARPEIFNTDQGVQFTSDAFTSLLRAAGIQI